MWASAAGPGRPPGRSLREKNCCEPARWLMGWDMVPRVGWACRGLCDAGCGGEIALSKEERMKLERWVSTPPSVRHSEYTLTTCPKKWDHLNDSMCDRIESEWSVDGNIHD